LGDIGKGAPRDGQCTGERYIRAAISVLLRFFIVLGQFSVISRFRIGVSNSEENKMGEFNQEQTTVLSSFVEPDRFSTGISNRELHIHDISSHVGTLPAGIIWPLSTEEVSRILAWTYSQEIPVTPWGAGTSTEGNPVPTRGGLVMDFTRMNKILAIRPQDLQTDVQPGVLRKELNRQTGRYGLFFPVDPGADASIGGMIANNASGVQTIKYGATRVTETCTSS